jgi:ankyrin repeat protein
MSLNQPNVYDKYKNYSKNELTDELLVACQNGELELVKYLLTSPELKNKPDVNINFGAPLIWAAQFNGIDIVKYLLTSEELPKKANIKKSGGKALILACINGNPDIVKYLLGSPELKNHADIHYDNDEAFRWACENGNIDIIKYMLFSPEIKEHINIHDNQDRAFKLACEKANEQKSTLEYFIFDLNIKRTININKYLKENYNPIAEHMFQIRKVNKDLNKNLPTNKIGKIKTNKL